MIKNHIAIQVPVAILLGFVTGLSISFVWGLYLGHSPFLTWMSHSVLLPGHKIAFYAVIYTHDVLVSIALAYPFAMLFAHIYRPTVGWRFIFIAALTIFIFGYWSVLTSGGAVAFFVDLAPQSIIGAMKLVGSLPIAYYLVRTQSQSQAAV